MREGHSPGNLCLCLRIARELFLHGDVNSTRARLGLDYMTNPLIRVGEPQR